MDQDQLQFGAAVARRWLLRALACGAPLALLPACSENPVIGRSQLILVSDEQLAQLSVGAWAQLKAQTPLAPAGPDSQRLAHIGRAIADVSGAGDLDWEFALFDSPEVNAFVLPGGKVGFFRGLFDLAGDDAEIAVVMGHEVGHVLSRHAAERMSQQLAVQAGVSVAALVLSGSEEVGAFADEIAAALGMGLVYGVILPYSREHELEADRLGVAVMANAGYAPDGAPRFWRRMIALSGQGPEPLAWLSTHPANADRLAALEAQVATLAPAAG